MRKTFLAFALLWSSLASAKVVNVEFKFTPYTGDVQQDHVQSVPGKAKIFINNMLYAEQDIDKDTVMVIFDEREIGPKVWVPMHSVGPILRTGKNSIRVEFEPSDAKAPYSAELSWASVNDETTEGESESGAMTATNQSGEGKDSRQVTGKVVFEHEFTADFADDQAWHHYPAITALSDADKQQIAALIAARSGGFRPDFSAVYSVLAGKPGMDIAAIKQTKCLDSAYAAGVRVSIPSADQLDFSLTGNPEVVVQRKGGPLYDMGSPAVFGKIKGDEAQMCAAMVLSMAFPPHVSVVRTPAGAWEVVY